MPISGRELESAAEAARLLLERLGLEDWYFSLEPKLDAPWELRLECAGEGWRALAFPVDQVELARSLEDPELADRLLADWRRRLAACRMSPATGASPPLDERSE